MYAPTTGTVRDAIFNEFTTATRRKDGKLLVDTITNHTSVATLAKTAAAKTPLVANRGFTPAFGLAVEVPDCEPDPEPVETLVFL